MSDLKLFRIEAGVAQELSGGSMALEKSLQGLLEANMEVLFGVRFVASEFSTGAKHRGRIDSLGLDENGSPVIFEYKRAVNENVINQGLFYLDWLMDHRGDFTVLVQETLGSSVSQTIDFANPRLVCVASDFTRYDEHAIVQMNRSIELVRYRDFQGELLALDLVASISTNPMATDLQGGKTAAKGKPSKTTPGPKTVSQLLEQSPPPMKDLYAQVEAFVLALGDDVSKKTTRFYVAFRRIKNFACIEVHPQAEKLLVYVKVDPDSITLESGFTRDVRNIGHFGTGDLEITIRTAEDLARCQFLLVTSYQKS